MNPLERWRLKLFCKQHGIDYQEIDNEISYYENKQHLEQFAHKTPEDLAQEYGRILSIMEKEVGLGERYGAIPESEEQPLLFYQTVVFFKARSVNLVKAYLKPYEKQLRFFKRSYIVITAQVHEATAIMQSLENRGVKVSLVGRSMVYQRVWQFISGQGWRKINV